MNSLNGSEKINFFYCKENFFTSAKLQFPFKGKEKKII